ncbi:GTP-binding protein [Luteipulveratus mongoliensis]|uniref:CobW C-terminal domain-containing protein n=1 Tax=Luteipulveratus mongoliensis TaxID=571913 RepID=A0A0K1JFX9_9MICO|nr:GTP-binding protein [Luteipulveratus mongoliensis]AKU15609.1 hypothetical protein VV02_06640 [Luteipulveratus mongoliensis]
MDSRVPVVVLTGLDRLDLDSAALAIQCDLPGSVLLRVEIDEEAGAVRRVASDLTGVIEDEATPLEHPCLSCAMREVILPAMIALAEAGRWSAIVVELPVAAEPLPLVVGITGLLRDEGAAVPLRLANVIAVIGSDVDESVFGQADLTDVGLGLSEDDQRSYAEVFVAQVELADTIVVVGSRPTQLDLDLLHHLHREGAGVVLGTGRLEGRELVRAEHHADASRAFVDPRRRRRPAHAVDDATMVTVELASWKPFHPQRLLDRLRDLAEGEMRGRGAMWLPGRPDAAIAWEAIGGRLSLGGVGDWDGAQRASRWVVTCCPEIADRVTRAFRTALLTDQEMLTARTSWAGRPDGFEQWLGDASSSAA